MLRTVVCAALLVLCAVSLLFATPQFVAYIPNAVGLQALPSGIGSEWEADCITFSGGMCSTPADGTTSFVWDDESGNANNLSQGGGTCTFHTSQTPSGKPAVTFSSCKFNAIADFGLDSGAGGTEFIVFKSATASGQGVLLGSGSQSGSKPELYIATMSILFGINSQGVSTLATDLAPRNNTNWNNMNTIIPGYPDTVDWGFRLNEANDACGSGCNSNVPWGNSFNSVGWEGINTDPPFSGQIAAIITYPKLLTVPQRQVVENYLKNKYGV